MRLEREQRWSAFPARAWAPDVVDDDDQDLDVPEPDIQEFPEEEGSS